MKVCFPGTAGEIDVSPVEHKFHSSVIIISLKKKILIDYGTKHAPFIDKDLDSIDALLITHAHPDHYIWTKSEPEDFKKKVYLTKPTYDYGKYKPEDFKIIKTNKTFNIGDIHLEAFDVIHSIRCPAVCYRISSGNKGLVYAPDILDTVQEKASVFKDIDCLIADGSSLDKNLARRRDGKLFGHSMVKTIINWCKKYSIKRLIITHCGKQIVSMDKILLKESLEKYSDKKLKVEVAYDGWNTVV